MFITSTIQNHLTFSKQNVIIFGGDDLSFFDYDFGIKEIVVACYVAPGGGDFVHNNRPSHGLAFRCSGIVEYIFDDGTSMTLKENEIIFLPKDSSYRVEDVIQGDCYAINFGLSDDVSFSPFVFKTKDSRAFLDMFSSAEKSWRTKKTAYKLKCKSILYNLIFKMQTEHGDYMGSQKYERIAPVVTYINENYTEKALRVDELAAMANMTPEYFRKIFNARHGISPCEYIRTLKLKRMAELLLSGMYTVSGAAVMSGFDDISYCSREFKKKYGVSPREYIKTPRD